MKKLEPPNTAGKSLVVSSKAKYAVIYALRVVQLFAIGLGCHFFLKAIGNIATGKLRTYVLGFALSCLVLVASFITLAYLRSKYPGITERALESADQRFDTPVSARTQTIFKVLLFGFILLVVGYMTICLFWNPPWLP
jgi:hypothetical protein